MLEEAAAEMAQATVPTDRVTLSSGEPDLVDATMHRISGELAFRANLKTIQSANEMTDVLLQLLNPPVR